MNEQTDLFRQLDALLDKERLALLNGDLPVLSDLVVEKETVMDRLNKLELAEIERFEPLNNKAIRNQALLEKTLEGIRSVAQRLADLRQARRSFDTYDHMGKRSRIEPDTKSSVEKRA